MNSSPVLEDKRVAFNTRINLIKQRRAGVDVQAQRHAENCERLNALEERAQEIATALLPRLEQSREQIAAITEKTVAILNEAEIALSNKQKQEQWIVIKSIQKSLKEALPEMKANLDEEKREKERLTSMLEELRIVLKNTFPYNSRGFFDQVCERGSYRIAHGKNPPPSKDTRHVKQL